MSEKRPTARDRFTKNQRVELTGHGKRLFEGPRSRFGTVTGFARKPKKRMWWVVFVRHDEAKRGRGYHMQFWKPLDTI